MCGICGYFGTHGGLDERVLRGMNDAIVRRGPDAEGYHVQPGVGLAMRRLSIIDLAGGDQPIYNEDGSVAVVFNGEIYNYRELRDELERRGHRFRTHSDTEVLVHLYEDTGIDLVDRLRGMFAFALWDAARERGFLVRDRLGIKPLHYAEVGGALVFGSEIKSILAAGVVARRLDHQALDAYLALTYIPAPLTIHEGIRKLEPGHLIEFGAGRVHIREYWDVDFSALDVGTREGEWIERVGAALGDAVGSHLVSDVPLGAFLSGGIDSSLTVALMSERTPVPVRTFTMGFGGRDHALIDERPLADEVARRYGCLGVEHTVRPDFRGIVDEIVTAFDEPFADDSVVPSYYLCELTRRHVKVALSGLGGDELFAGYQRYTGMLLARMYGRLVPSSVHRHVVAPLVRRLPEPIRAGDRINHAKRFAAAAMDPAAQRYLGFVSTLSANERRSLFRPEIAAEIDFEATDRLVTDRFEHCDAPDDIARALYTDLKTYLPDDILALSDRISMWHSLEVRVPLVDHQLVELCARLPTRYKIGLRERKRLLRRIARGYLPDTVLAHPKQGFESPMGAWLRTDLAPYARDILGDQRLGATGLFDPAFVRQRLDEHIAGRHKHSKLLFSLMMFQAWHEHAGSPSGPARNREGVPCAA